MFTELEEIKRLSDEMFDLCGGERPKTTYKVVITETLQKVVEVELPIGSAYEALDMVKDLYKNGEVVLSADDHLETEFDFADED